MVEGFSLPDAAGLTQEAIDFTRRVSLDFSIVLSQLMLGFHLNQDVDVVGHDDKTLDIAPLFIEVKQGIMDAI